MATDFKPFDDYNGARPGSMKEAEGKRVRIWQIAGSIIWLLWLLAIVFSEVGSAKFNATPGFFKFLGIILWVVTLWLILTAHRNTGTKSELAVKKIGLIAGIIFTTLSLTAGYWY